MGSEDGVSAGYGSTGDSVVGVSVGLRGVGEGVGSGSGGLVVGGGVGLGAGLGAELDGYGCGAWVVGDGIGVGAGCGAALEGYGAGGSVAGGAGDGLEPSPLNWLLVVMHCPSVSPTTSSRTCPVVDVMER